MVEWKAGHEGEVGALYGGPGEMPGPPSCLASLLPVVPDGRPVSRFRLVRPYQSFRRVVVPGREEVVMLKWTDDEELIRRLHRRHSNAAYYRRLARRWLGCVRDMAGILVIAGVVAAMLWWGWSR